MATGLVSFMATRGPPESPFFGRKRDHVSGIWTLLRKLKKGIWGEEPINAELDVLLL